MAVQANTPDAALYLAALTLLEALHRIVLARAFQGPAWQALIPFFLLLSAESSVQTLQTFNPHKAILDGIIADSLAGVPHPFPSVSLLAVLLAISAAMEALARAIAARPSDWRPQVVWFCSVLVTGLVWEDIHRADWPYLLLATLLAAVWLVLCRHPRPALVGGTLVYAIAAFASAANGKRLAEALMRYTSCPVYRIPAVDHAYMKFFIGAAVAETAYFTDCAWQTCSRLVAMRGWPDVGLALRQLFASVPGRTRPPAPKPEKTD